MFSGRETARKELEDEIMDMQEQKKRKNKLAIGFVVLLTLCAPLGYLYFMLVMQMLSYVSDEMIKTVLLLALIPIFLYWLVIGIFGILNIKKSFQLYRKGDTVACMNGMLIHKYGLVIFFCANFIVLGFWYGLFSMAAVMGTRGLLLLFAPVLLPVWVVGLCVSIFATWLAILPGSIYGIQVIRMSYKAGKISLIAAILHTILQFFFLTDVLDAMYLAAGKWNRGKKSSLVIGAVYLISVIGIILLIMKIRSAL